MIPYKSIFEIDDLTVDELMSINQRKVFDYRKRAFYASNLKALTEDEKWILIRQWEKTPITEEEYNQITSQIERYEDLFQLYLHRGEFDLAYEYERLAGLNYIDLWKIPRDVVQQNEPEYYEWRTSELLRRAIDIAKEAHKGQVDKAGNDYIGHPLRVMAAGKTTEEKIVGVLHDVVEDTDWTFERLAAEGFSAEVIEALRCVTKLSENEPYDKFITRVKENPLAVVVKLNDLSDNMDIRRLPYISDKDVKRLKKYLKAYKQLTGTPTYSVFACQQEYPNAYKSWTEEDDLELTQMWCEGATTKELATHFQRKPSAITSRIKKLELEEKYGELLRIK